MKPTPTLARIMALYEQRRELWERSGKLGQADRGRLLDIAEELDSLWNKRRMEKAGIDADRLPAVVVHPFEADARRTRWTRGRSRAKRPAWHSEMAL